MSIHNAIHEENIVAYILDDINVIFLPLNESAPLELIKIGLIDLSMPTQIGGNIQPSPGPLKHNILKNPSKEYTQRHKQ